MRNPLLPLIAAVLLQWASAAPVSAQEPVPEHMREALASFISATGWQNADGLAASTTYRQLTEQIYLFRVAAKAACDAEGDLCLTIIGAVRNGGFVAETVFYAGERFEAANNAFALGGSPGPSLFFIRLYGKKQGVTAMPAPTGWIVIPSTSLDDFKGSKN